MRPITLPAELRLSLLATLAAPMLPAVHAAQVAHYGPLEHRNPDHPPPQEVADAAALAAEYLLHACARRVGLAIGDDGDNSGTGGVD